MGKTLHMLIVGMASLTASVMLIIGLRNIHIDQRKRHGLFMTALFIALTLSGCSINPRTTNQVSQTPAPTNKNTNAQQPTAGKIAALNNTTEWKNFKIFWQRLDNIAPTANSNNNSGSANYYGEYYNALSQADGYALRQELKTPIANLQTLSAQNLITPLEIEVLNNICSSRIDYMTNYLASMVTRMMPPPIATDRDYAIKDLEKKIDVLLELRDNKIISTSELQLALANIQEDVWAYSILNTITSHYVWYYYTQDLAGDRALGTDVAILDGYIQGFEEHYANYQKQKANGTINTSDASIYKDIDTKYQETKQAISDLKAALPSLNELIADLVIHG
jgi:hypothetical protein